jgi:hypothetical protein
VGWGLGLEGNDRAWESGYWGSCGGGGEVGEVGEGNACALEVADVGLVEVIDVDVEGDG